MGPSLHPVRHRLFPLCHFKRICTELERHSSHFYHVTVRVNHDSCSYCGAENGNVWICRDIKVIINPFLLVNQNCCTLGVRICLAENKLLVKWIWQMHICRCSWKMNHDISWQQTHQNVCFATLFHFGYCISYIYCKCTCLWINQSSTNEENSLLSTSEHNTTVTISWSQKDSEKHLKQLNRFFRKSMNFDHYNGIEKFFNYLWPLYSHRRLFIIKPYHRRLIN